MINFSEKKETFDGLIDYIGQKYRKNQFILLFLPSHEETLTKLR
jgi:hypothetical protein